MLILLMLFAQLSFADDVEISLVPNIPEWAQAGGRSVIGGDIIHFGTATASQADMALFRAKQMAIASILDECGGYASKSIAVRQTHTRRDPSGFISYVNASIQFDDCEKGANTKGKIPLALQNEQIVADQKLYRKMVRSQSGLNTNEEEEKEASDLEKLRLRIEAQAGVTEDLLLHIAQELKETKFNSIRADRNVGPKCKSYQISKIEYDEQKDVIEEESLKAETERLARILKECKAEKARNK